MLYLRCVFIMLNEKLQLQKINWCGQLLDDQRSHHAQLDSHWGLREASQLNQHEFSICRNWPPLFQKDILTGSATLDWPSLDWWTQWYFLSLPRPQTHNCDSQQWGEIAGLLLPSRKRHIKNSAGTDIFMLHLPPRLKFWEVTPLPRLRIPHLQLNLTEKSHMAMF